MVLYEVNSGNENECDNNNLFLFVEKGAYETFNINMKQIHKYSTGLIHIIYCNWCKFINIYNIFYLSFFSESGPFITFLCGGVLYILGSILNLIFFIILSVYYYKGKYKELEDLSKCNNINYDNFMDIYGFIFEIQKNYKKVFIVDIIISLNFYLLLLCIIILICMPL